MASPSPLEAKLLDTAKAFDDAVARKDISKIYTLLTDSFIVHKDGCTLTKDIKGKPAGMAWLKAYFEKYEYLHEAIAGAVNEDEWTAFSFWYDKNVLPREDELDEDLPGWVKNPSETVGIWYFDFDADSTLIANLWFARQLSADEVYRKLQNPPKQIAEKGFDIDMLKGSPFPESVERRKKMISAAQAYNDLWAKSNAAPADLILDQNVHVWDPVLGEETKGLKEFKQMLEASAQKYEVTHNNVHIAATAGNKAFIYWLNHLKPKGSPEATGHITVYGLNLLVFSAEGKIIEVIGFRQPMPNERAQIVKPEVLNA